MSKQKKPERLQTNMIQPVMIMNEALKKIDNAGFETVLVI